MLSCFLKGRVTNFPLHTNQSEYEYYQKEMLNELNHKESISSFLTDVANYSPTFVFTKNIYSVYYISKKYCGYFCILTIKAMTVIKIQQNILYCNSMNGTIDTWGKMTAHYTFKWLSIAVFFIALGSSVYIASVFFPPPTSI